jgi:hypothetical protein
VFASDPGGTMVLTSCVLGCKFLAEPVHIPFHLLNSFSNSSLQQVSSFVFDVVVATRDYHLNFTDQ